MKSIKITYWITTSLISAMMLMSGIMYFVSPEAKSGFQHLGFPDYFRIELGLAKIIGVLVLILPIGKRIKEWSYAGFTITFISAFAAHLSSGDPFSKAVGPLIALVILFVSYFMFHKMNSQKK